MPDTLAWQLAMRERAKTLALVTTGVINVSASITGYHRAIGSFAVDGFLTGMELVATGFGVSTNNGPHTITKVTASDLEINGGCTAEAEAGGRILAVGLPSRRAWENVDFKAIQGQPHVEEQFIPGPANLVSGGQNGRMIYEPLYSLAVYGIIKVGLGGVVKYADGILALFAPKLALPLANGDILRVRGDTAPFRGQMIFRQDVPDHAVIPVTIPFRIETFNTL